MSELERLCVMLREQGVDYVRNNFGVTWDYYGSPHTADESIDGTLIVTGLTPEQVMAATVGHSCAACPEMGNPDSYIRHLQSALKWHDEHVPRPTNPRATCVVLQGEKPPEEVLFVGPDGVTHYLPEGAGTCKNVGEGTFVCSKCGAHVQVTNVGRSYVDKNGKRWYSTSNEHKFCHCPNCGRRI